MILISGHSSAYHCNYLTMDSNSCHSMNMAQNIDGRSEQSTGDKISALQPGQERILLPFQDGIIRIGALKPALTAAMVTFEPSEGTVRIPGEPPPEFTILYETPRQPEVVLSTTVTELTLSPYRTTWRLRQNPDRLVSVNSPEGFDLFWRLVAHGVRRVREKSGRADV